MFAFDILFNFNTTIYDHEGNEEWDRKKIAKEYVLSSQFWIDVLSTFPFPGNNALFEFLPALKVVKVTILSKIIKKLDVKDDVKALIKAL